MKSLIRKVATIGLVGGAIAAPLMQSQQAMALPQEEVLKKLGSVLVYTVVSVDEAKKQAIPLTAAVKQGDKNFNVALVFFSPQDAQKFVDQQKEGATALKAKDPKGAEEQLKLLNSTQVAPDSLATFYDAATKSKQALKIQFMPIEQQLKSAVALQKDFQGVPLFRVNFGQNRYGTSFFLSKEDLQNELVELKKNQAELASQAKIEVVPLEGLIEILATQSGDDLKKIRVFAPLESRKLLKSILDQSQKPGTGAPAAPAAPAGKVKPVAPKK
jgi:Tic22-like family